MFEGFQEVLVEFMFFFSGKLSKNWGHWGKLGRDERDLSLILLSTLDI